MNTLYRSKNKLVFGVCGGLAKYTGYDVSLIRLSFIIGFFITGSILLWIYLLMGIIIPKEE